MLVEALASDLDADATVSSLDNIVRLCPCVVFGCGRTYIGGQMSHSGYWIHLHKVLKVVRERCVMKFKLGAVCR